MLAKQRMQVMPTMQNRPEDKQNMRDKTNNTEETLISVQKDVDNSHIKIKYNEPLAQHTSWHIGGFAERYYRPNHISDLLEFLKTLPEDEPLTWLGLGSNVLINDAGIKGTVIHTLGMGEKKPSLAEEDSIEEDKKNTVLIRAEVGIPCAKLAKFCIQQGLKGGEFFAGIPGTVGGALAMNAGAFGGETWNVVEKVEVVNRKGEPNIRFPQEYEIAYRTVRSPKAEEWFLAGYFRFEKGDASIAEEAVKQLLRKRSASQPIGVFSCGSVFKNPPHDFAARLIEASGLKGYSINDAEISTKHANFIINRGKARAEDILNLIRHITETVWEKHQVRLQCEVRLLGWDNGTSSLA